MQLTERIHLVGSGRGGLRLSNLLDCNVFLLDGRDESALIDAGCGLEPERIVAQIESSGVDILKLSTLLLTHAHADHAAGAKFWHDEFGLKIVCAEEAKPWIETADAQKTSFQIARDSGVYPADFEFRTCPIARGVLQNDEIQIGDIALKVLETPGHARGHLSFLLEENRALFGGDICFAKGEISPQITWDFSTAEYSASIRKLHQLNINQLFPGHGPPLLSHAHWDIEIAHNAFSRFKLPRYS